MRIGILAPADDTLPPKFGSSSVETLVFALVKQLASRGFEVHVWASNDSNMGRMRNVVFHAYKSKSMRSMGLTSGEKLDAKKLQLSRQALQEAARLNLDVLHMHEHTAMAALGETHYFPCEVMTTLHWSPADLIIAQSIEAAPSGHKIVPISNSQRELGRSLYPHIHFMEVVYNGLDLGQFTYSRKRREHLAWVGRCCREKGLHIAIDTAVALQMPLVVAAKVSTGESQAYFDEEIAPRLQQHPHLVSFIREAHPDEVRDILAHAHAALMPNCASWVEPFGLVAVQSLACGTPVIATASGALTEIVNDGRNGFIIDPNLPEEVIVTRFAECVRSLDTISRRACLNRAKEFSLKEMVGGYAAQFETLKPAPVIRQPRRMVPAYGAQAVPLAA